MGIEPNNRMLLPTARLTSLVVSSILFRFAQQDYAPAEI